jgi:hypothetical protein
VEGGLLTQQALERVGLTLYQQGVQNINPLHPERKWQQPCEGVGQAAAMAPSQATSLHALHVCDVRHASLQRAPRACPSSSLDGPSPYTP